MRRDFLDLASGAVFGACLAFMVSAVFMTTGKGDIPGDCSQVAVTGEYGRTFTIWDGETLVVSNPTKLECRSTEPVPYPGQPGERVGF